MIQSNQIPTYNIFINPKDLQDLRSDIWCDDPVTGVLNFNKKKYDIDIVYRGAHTRKLKKKSYHINFYKPKFFMGSKELHLNAEYRDPSMMRNKLSLDFFSEIGILSPKSQHVFVNINGKQEGIYLQLESVDKKFLQKRNCPEGAIFYAIDGDANFSLVSDLDKEVKKSLSLGYELKYGSTEEMGYLENFIYKVNTLSHDDFEKEIDTYLNVPNYLRWLAGVVFTQNYDGFVHNYALYRNNQTEQFEVIPWDYDGTWGRDVNGKMMESNYVRIEGFNTLTARLLAKPIYRMQYRDLVNSILNNEFTVENMQPKIEKLYQQLRPFVLKDPYKKEDINQFDMEPEFILQFINKRRNYIHDRLDKLQ